jgi:hypothetical protein
MATEPFDTVKTFTSSRPQDREELGARVTAWLRAHPGLTPVDTVVTQSSDAAFHCLTITMFLRSDDRGQQQGG